MVEETEEDGMTGDQRRVESVNMARDITSYDLRKPWDTTVGNDQHPHLAWMPTKEGSLEMVEMSDFPVAPVNQAHVNELYHHYVDEVKNLKDSLIGHKIWPSLISTWKTCILPSILTAPGYWNLTRDCYPFPLKNVSCFWKVLQKHCWKEILCSITTPISRLSEAWLDR